VGKIEKNVVALCSPNIHPGFQVPTENKMNKTILCSKINFTLPLKIYAICLNTGKCHVQHPNYARSDLIEQLKRILTDLLPFLISRPQNFTSPRYQPSNPIFCVSGFFFFALLYL